MTLLSTVYKIYAMTLNDRIKKEIETKKILPDTQAGFRKGRGRDNIYILQHVTEKATERKKGKLCFHRPKGGLR